MPIGPTSGFLDFTNATPRANVIIALSNVGVGTDVPLHALDIRGTANVADIIINNDLTLVGGLTTNTLTINSVSMSTTSNFQQVTNVGDAATTNTVQFTNPTTGFTVSSNAEVGGELSVSGNTVVSSNLTVSGNVGIGTTEPTESLDIVGNLNLQKVSNTASIKLNSNVVTEYVRSKKSLIKYPRVAMTAATTSGYTASASSDNNGIRPAYLAFDNILYSSWHEPVYTTNPYPNADGAYTGGSGTVYDTNGYEGEYLQIQLPEKIKLYSYSISSRSGTGLAGRQPKDAKIFASNDGSTWIDIHTHNDVGETYNTNGETRTFQLDNITETYYIYYRLVVNSIIEGGTSDTPNTSQWQLYGIPEYDPEAHGTDVIMRSVPNVPNTDWLEVYYDGQDYTSMPSTVTDKSGNSVTGTPNGGVGFDTEYKAFTFDGTGDIRSTVSTFSGDQPHTMSTWVYISSALDTTDGYICVLAPSTGENLDQVSTIRFQNDGFNMQSWGNDIQMYNLGIQKERWYHLTAVYDGGGVTTTSKRLYINGVQNLTISDDATSGNTINFTNTTLSLGSRVDGAGSHLKGSIANFRLFNRALTGDEIWQLYAYQKDYFQVSPDVVTFKGGRLGIGTSEPRAVLDVKGDLYAHGSVVQVLQSVKTNSASTNSTSFVDTGLEITITPKSTSSKILVSYSANIGTNTSHAFLRLVRNGTSIAIGDAAGNRVQCTHYIRHFNSQSLESHCMEFLDSPSTTSSVTYKLQYSVASTSYTVTLNRAHSDGDNTYYGRGPSTITAKEIAQ
jgi:hypothetical protein